MSDYIYPIEEKLEQLIKAGDELASYLYYFIEQRDKGSKYITAVPRIGMTLALEDWDYSKGLKTDGR